MSWTKKKKKEETLPKIFNNYLELTAAIQQQKKAQKLEDHLRLQKVQQTLARLRAGKSLSANTPYEDSLEIYERTAMNRKKKYKGEEVLYKDMSYNPPSIYDSFEFLISLLPFMYQPQTSEAVVKSWLNKICNTPPPPSRAGHQVLLNVHLPVTQGSLYDYALLVNKELNRQVPNPTIDFTKDNLPHITIAMMAFQKDKIQTVKNLIQNYVLEEDIVITKWQRPVTPPGGPVGPYGMIWTIDDGGSITRVLSRLFPMIREFIHPSAFQFIPPWLKFSRIDIIKEKLRSVHTCGSANISVFEPHLTVCHTLTPQAWSNLDVTPAPLKPVPQIISRIDIQYALKKNGSVIRDSWNKTPQQLKKLLQA